MSTYKTYGYAMVRYSMDKLVAAVRLALGAFADFGWLAQRLPQRRTIGKEHRGYARRSRQRLVQRRG